MKFQGLSTNTRNYKVYLARMLIILLTSCRIHLQVETNRKKENKFDDHHKTAPLRHGTNLYSIILIGYRLVNNWTR